MQVPRGHQVRLNNIAVSKEQIVAQNVPFTVQFCRSTASVTNKNPFASGGEMKPNVVSAIDALAQDY